MNIEYCKGTPADRQEILDFADLVFSKNSRPHDFATLLPKLYGPDRNFEPLHYMVKEDGKIRAMICVLPMEFRSGEETLRFNGVGTVSVHPCARGRGYMKKLMTWALEDMKQDGTVFSTLSGLRQRYEYFGYTPVGRKLSWNLNRDNLRHRYSGRTFLPVVLSPMTRQDAPTYAAMYRKSGAGTVRSDEDFLTILRSWNAQPTAVTLEGKPVGYFCRTGGTIQEMVLENPELLPDVLHAIFQNPEVEWLSLFLPEWETGLSAILKNWQKVSTPAGTTTAEFLILQKPSRSFCRSRLTTRLFPMEPSPLRWKMLLPLPLPFSREPSLFILPVRKKPDFPFLN